MDFSFRGIWVPRSGKMSRDEQFLEFFFLGIRSASIQQVGAAEGNWRAGENVSNQITFSSLVGEKRDKTILYVKSEKGRHLCFPQSKY